MTKIHIRYGQEHYIVGACMIRLLAKRTAIHSAGIVLGRAISTVAFIVLARELGPKNLGIVVFIYTIIQIMTQVANWGLVQWYQKNVTIITRKKLFKKTVSARLVTLAISLILLVTISLFTPLLREYLLFAVILLVIESLIVITPAYYLEIGKPEIIAIQNPIKYIPLLFGLLIMPVNIDMAFLLVIAGSFAVVLSTFPWSLLSLQSFKDSLKTLKASSKYAFLTLTSLTYARADALVVQYSLGNTAMGLYSAAYRYLDAINIIPSSLSQNLFPMAAKKHAYQQKSIYKYIGLITFIGAVVGMALFVLSNFLTVGLLGQEYALSTPVIKALSVSAFLFFVNAPLSTVVQSSDLVNQFLPWGILNTALNVVLNILLIPVFGITSAAIIMGITEATGLIINAYFLRKLVKS